MINLHLGCGPVYLVGWLNIDIEVDGYSYLTKDRPDILKYNMTRLDKYYKYPYYDRKHNLAVADVFMDISKIPYPYDDNSVDRILIVNTFEHFDEDTAKDMLKEWFRILKPDGELIIDGIPDLKKTIKMLGSRYHDERWVISLIYGSQKNEFSFHKWGYTYWGIRELCEKIGYSAVDRFNEIHHEYPTFGIRAIK